MDDARPISVHPGTYDDNAAARAASADPEAFAVIYERHWLAVYRYLRSRTRTDEEALELSAVTFERALRWIGRFSASGGGLAAWLVRIARNAHIDATRRESSQAVAGMTIPDSTDDAGLAHDDAAILRALVDDLPAEQRDAIQLRFAAGLTAREIGVVLGVTEEAAQKRVERGIRSLKEAYGVA